MQISELKQIAPLEDVHELKADGLYLVKLPHTMEAGIIRSIADNLTRVGINGVLCDDSVAFFELDPTAHYLIRVPEHSARAAIVDMVSRLQEAGMHGVLCSGEVTFEITK